MKGYDYQLFNPLIVKHIYKKSVYDTMTVDQCLQMLNRGISLELKAHVLEKLEMYLLDRIFRAEQEHATAEASSSQGSRFNENRI